MPPRSRRVATKLFADVRDGQGGLADNQDDHDENNFHSAVESLQPRVRGDASSEHRVLCDITDQFLPIDPPSPSPIRSRSQASQKRLRRIKVPNTSARTKSTDAGAPSPLPLSSPLPPSSIYDHDPSADSSQPITHLHPLHSQRSYRTSPDDPFGFLAAERKLKAQRGPTVVSRNRIHGRSVLPIPVAAFNPAPVVAQATNDVDIEELYADDNTAVASPLAIRPSQEVYSSRESAATRTRIAPLIPDPLRTPRKRTQKRKVLEHSRWSTGLRTPLSDSVPSSPSPAKIHDLPYNSSRDFEAISSAEDDAVTPLGITKINEINEGVTTRLQKKKKSKIVRDISSDIEENLPRRMALRTKAPQAKVFPRKSTRKAAGKLGVVKKDTDEENIKPKSLKARKKAPVFKGKGKAKASDIDDLLDLNDDEREKYARERKARLDYFKKLDSFQIETENVYII